MLDGYKMGDLRKKLFGFRLHKPNNFLSFFVIFRGFETFISCRNAKILGFQGVKSHLTTLTTLQQNPTQSLYVKSTLYTCQTCLPCQVSNIQLNSLHNQKNANI
jgi:hypothetical protein